MFSAPTQSRWRLWSGSRPLLILGLVGLLGLLGLPLRTEACPFCSAVAQTFAEEMKSVDAVVLAQMVEEPIQADSGEYVDLPVGKFKIIEVLKGDDAVSSGGTIETYYYGSKFDATFLIMGTDPQDIIWSSPLALTDRAVEYVRTVANMEPDQQRLRYFMDFLEDEDEVLARDAYDEFAKAPYEEVVALKESMDREKLVAWIKDTDTVPASRRSLYITMLGVCGQKEDVAMLERFMRSDVREEKVGLNAMIACYLTLQGEEGMELIHELFLSNPEAEYADTYSAISALRFHGAETDVLPRESVLNGFRALLNRPDLADLVIPDLARYEDWSVLPRLVELFRNSDEESNWVRVPIVNYVRACPLPEAELALEQLEELDPNAVKRASMFMPFASQNATAEAAENSGEESGDLSDVSEELAPADGDDYASLQPQVPPDTEAAADTKATDDEYTPPDLISEPGPSMRTMVLVGIGAVVALVIAALFLIRGNPATN